MSDEICMEHTWSLLKEEIAVAEFSFPEQGFLWAIIFFLPPAFTEIGCFPSILAQVFLANEVWFCRYAVYPMRFLPCLFTGKEGTVCCMRQAAACSFIINYLPEKENFPIWEHFIFFVDRRCWVMNGHENAGAMMAGQRCIHWYKIIRNHLSMQGTWPLPFQRSESHTAERAWQLLMALPK